jgi:alanine dehydrogenase
MKIGCVREIKKHEYRVGLTPYNVKAYVCRGHKVFIEKEAGVHAGFADAQYIAAGAEIISDRRKIFDDSDMIVKVKEPLPEECDLFHEDQILFTYLHLAALPETTQALLNKKIKAVAYETIEQEDGSLPCLKPMSEIAGRLSAQQGAKYLEKTYGGRGVLLGGVPGVRRGYVSIIGGGVVGMNACKIAVGMGARVTVLDVGYKRMAYLDDIFHTQVTTLYSNDENLEYILQRSDVIIGAVLLPGARAPKLIKKEHLSMMKKGAVIVDVAIDQGGCIETSRATSHDDPIYIVDDIVHYCVTNMPGVVALSATKALTSTTLPYGLLIAEHGLEGACRISPELKKGVNLYRGQCVYEAVAQSLNINYQPLVF